MIKELIFIAHEENQLSGANVVLDAIAKKSTINNNIILMKYEKGFKNRLLRIKKFISIGKKEKIFHLNTIAALDLAILSKILGRKYLLHLHESEKLINKCKIWIINIFRINVICVDTRLKNSIKKCQLITNPVNIDGTSESGLIDLSKMKYAIIGTIDENKNQIRAIQIFNEVKRNREDTLAIIGKITDFNYKSKLDAIVYNTVSRIKFIESIKRVDIHASYDVLIGASKNESFGLAVAEAINIGKIIIIDDFSAYPNLNLNEPNVFDVRSFKKFFANSSDKIISNYFGCLKEKKLKELNNNNSYFYNSLNRIYSENFGVDNCFQ